MDNETPMHIYLWVQNTGRIQQNLYNICQKAEEIHTSDDSIEEKYKKLLILFDRVCICADSLEIL